MSHLQPLDLKHSNQNIFQFDSTSTLYPPASPSPSHLSIPGSPGLQSPRAIHIRRTLSHRSLVDLDHAVIKSWTQYGLRPPPSPHSPNIPKSPTKQYQHLKASQTNTEDLAIYKFPQSKPTTLLNFKINLYNFLRKPHGPWSYVYHCFVSLVILVGIMFYAFSTVPDLKWWSSIGLHISDIIILAIYVVEYLVLFWASSCRPKYRSWTGQLLFLITPFRLLDLILIGIAAVVLWTHWFPDTWTHMTWLRCGQVFQILRLETRFQSWRLLKSVFWFERKHLLAAVTLAFFILVLMSYTMYFIEQADSGTNFQNIPVSMYWCIVTIFSIGYGDLAPTTTAGRIVTAFCTIFGYIIWALPAEILATGLALRVQELRHEKQIKKRRHPAALLIQAAWRTYATFEPSSMAIICRRFKPTAINKEGLNHRTHYNSYSTINLKESESTTLDNFTPVQLNAIRFLEKLKFRYARKLFRMAFQPYDIKDVLESYDAAHADVVERVRLIQAGIDAAQLKLSHFASTTKQLAVQRGEKVERLEKMLEELLQLSPNSINLLENFAFKTKFTTAVPQTPVFKFDFYDGGGSELDAYPAISGQHFIFPDVSNKQ